MKVMIDGKCFSEEQACLPVTDRGFLYGDGVFTTLRVNEGVPECLSLHIERLIRHCQALHIAPPEINPDWIQELLSENKALTGLWRFKIIITGGNTSTLDLTPRSHGHVVMMVQPYTPNTSLPCRLTCYPEPVCRPFSFIKTLSYLDRLWIKEYARAHGFDDAIVCSPEGYTLETAFSNLFWRQGNEIFTPDSLLPLLHGVSLHVVQEAAQQLGYQVHHVKASVKEIPSDAQIFTSNSVVGFIPVCSIDDQKFQRDESFEKQLQDTYRALVM